MKKFRIIFFIVAIIYVITLGIVTCYRGGKDLKVGLYGVHQITQKGSPYDNPTDPKRPIFRYAPPNAILQRPFLLSSRMTAPFEFDNIMPSVLMWYAAEILALVVSALILFKLIPSPSKNVSWRNLMASFLLASPLIGYELINCQNKIMALAFMLASIYMFRKNRFFLSALFFNIAIVIYIPLIFFIIYFIFRGGLKFIMQFIAAFLLVFIIVPSATIGYTFNNFLLKDYFLRCLKPFFMTTSYATYLDVRVSSQSLPSAIGRIFVSGPAVNYKYLISAELIHVIIRVFSTSIIILSVLAAWKRQKVPAEALQYTLFFLLAFVLPSYCLWYTWAWLFVIYFAVFNYISYPEVGPAQKKILLILTLILVLGSYSSAVKQLNIISVLCWSTLIFWAGITGLLIRRGYSKI